METHRLRKGVLKRIPCWNPESVVSVYVRVSRCGLSLIPAPEGMTGWVTLGNTSVPITERDSEVTCKRCKD